MQVWQLALTAAVPVAGSLFSHFPRCVSACACGVVHCIVVHVFVCMCVCVHVGEEEGVFYVLLWVWQPWQQVAWTND